MKKTFILLFLILTLIFSQNAIPLSLEQGNSLEFEGRTITAQFVQESKVVLEVDGEKNIINNGQSKTIKGIRIIVTDIFYSGEDSTVSFNAELTYTCGDGTCNDGETSVNCCQDCECPLGNQCTSNGCIRPECFLDEDCDDNKELTKDSCDNYKCKYRNINCNSNSQCDDNDPDTDDFCTSGKCQNLPPICKTDSDCEDPNPCTLDQCINKDCQYKPIENCKSPEKKEEPEKGEKTSEQTLRFTDESHPGFFSKFFSWLKNLF
ncbi:MAG: hypothetical protein CMH63_02175 [Nanoarchaeota archaeon]|jgi:hypothetical protein|nr:hypothetical protein [Nanoarchaeota archaeon]|tara:strand:+ start:9881 stop:10669 length:789 start_codon:yes stop_codon:yes gene_type:complete